MSKCDNLSFAYRKTLVGIKSLQIRGFIDGVSWPKSVQNNNFIGLRCNNAKSKICLPTNMLIYNKSSLSHRFFNVQVLLHVGCLVFAEKSKWIVPRQTNESASMSLIFYHLWCYFFGLVERQDSALARIWYSHTPVFHRQLWCIGGVTSVSKKHINIVFFYF